MSTFLFNFVVSGPEEIMTETENLSQGTEAQHSLSHNFFLSGDSEVEFTCIFLNKKYGKYGS